MTPSIQSWFQFNPTEEYALIAGMDVVERGLFFSLRIYAWANDGLPEDEEQLKKVARNSCGISSYKFSKVWPALREKFTKISSDRLGYERDEKKRLEPREPSETTAKFRQLGKKGALARWGNKPKEPSEQIPLSDSARHPTVIGSGWQDRQTEKDSRNTAAVENTTNTLAAAVEHSPCPNTFKLIASIFADVTPAFIGRLLGEAQKISPHITDDELASAVKATFKPNKQHSAGMFLDSVPAWLQNKIDRKPPTTETYIDSMGRVRSIATG